MNSFDQGAGQMTQYQTTPTPPATLASAISSLELLEKRLSEMTTGSYNLASLLGGPLPTRGEEVKAAAPPPGHAMARLNELVQSAHVRLTNINEAMAAMARSLGVNS